LNATAKLLAVVEDKANIMNRQNRMGVAPSYLTGNGEIAKEVRGHIKELRKN